MNVLALLTEQKIEAFEDVHKLLSQPPYNIKVKDRGSLYSLTYHLTHSDLNLEVVKECRGLFLRKGTNKIVAKGFTKFFNAREGKSCLDVINRESARFLEKVDGSLIKLYWDDEHECWTYGTNNMPSAKDASISNQDGAGSSSSFDDLIREARGYDVDFAKLNKLHTYCFELKHPLSQVVVSYQGAKELVFLGAVNIDTMEEKDDRSLAELGLPDWMLVPREFKFDSIEQCLEASKVLGSDQEGWVILDKHFNRIKIKGETYSMMLHYSAGARESSNFTDAQIFKVMCIGEVDEVCANLQHLKPAFVKWQKALDASVETLWLLWEKLAPLSKRALSSGSANDKKEFVLEAKNLSQEHFGLLLAIHNANKDRPDDADADNMTRGELKNLLLQSDGAMNQKGVLKLLHQHLSS